MADSPNDPRAFMDRLARQNASARVRRFPTATPVPAATKPAG